MARLIGVFAGADAAEQALRDLRAANFNPARATEDRFPGAQALEQRGRAVVTLDPEGREPEARAIMLRAGAERFIDEHTASPAQRVVRVGSPDVDAYLQAHGVPSTEGVDRGAPIPNAAAAPEREDLAEPVDEDARDSPIREVIPEHEEPEIDDRMRRATQRTI